MAPYLTKSLLENPLYKGKNSDILFKEMEKMQSLPLIAFDEIVSRACKVNNSKLMQVEDEVPMPGGNLTELSTILRGQKSPEGEEFTMV